MMRMTSMRCLALILFLTLVAGCGSDGPQRYRVSGTVTYDGQPVQAGRVIFEPDVDLSNSGPAGYADIRQGSYETLTGKGVVGGPHQIRVICLTGVPEGEELAEGRMLCPEYQQSLDLPPANTSHDIAVPGDWKW
jgi:hypothetical protein